MQTKVIVPPARSFYHKDMPALPADPEPHSGAFHFQSHYKPDTCCMVCDEKHAPHSPGCCPICPSLYHTFTGGHRPFGGPFGPGLSANPLKHMPEARPFIEQKGREFGLDETSALRDTRVVKLGTDDYLRAKREETIKHNEAIDKKQEEYDKHREKIQMGNEMRKIELQMKLKERLKDVTSGSSRKKSKGGSKSGSKSGGGSKASWLVKEGEQGWSICDIVQSKEEKIVDDIVVCCRWKKEGE